VNRRRSGVDLLIVLFVHISQHDFRGRVLCMHHSLFMNVSYRSKASRSELEPGAQWYTSMLLQDSIQRWRYNATTKKRIHLYLSPCSFLPCGSKPFRIPNKVLDTASLAPIIGFNTAIGTALTTAFNAPCSSALAIEQGTDLHHHLISRKLP
jgi:hypothetical protein